ncbi:unnamed protein product [Trichogramma brassicae]|uniref:Uncharacterized protein n=1 Tax=Trichogramma brassicae TaxID=86971 RepID=A0A6H5I989_9HYME|nr:unnamed protein product [Trichogramma brassicae]
MRRIIKESNGRRASSPMKVCRSEIRLSSGCLAPYRPKKIIFVKKRGFWLQKYFLEINDEIQQTVHVNTQDKKGNTPLHLALQADHQKIAEYLLEKGANPHLTNARGLTALHAICNDQKDRHALVKTFFKICKAKHQLVQVDARDNLDRTPLQLAVANLSLKTVDVLLKHGADLSSFVLPTMDHFCEVLNPGSMSNFKSNLASSAMELVELLEKKGYELDRKEALTIMALFAKYGLFQKSKDLEERWYDDEYLAKKAKKIKINSSQSLYDLLQLHPQDAAKQFALSDLFKFSHSKKLRYLHHSYSEACTAHLCETLSRRFFLRWAGNSLWELLHHRMPILCCDMINEGLMNEDLRNIYQTHFGFGGFISREMMQLLLHGQNKKMMLTQMRTEKNK